MIEKIQRLAKHFADGGQALNSRQIAELLDIDRNHVGIILFRIKQYNGVRWQAELSKPGRHTQLCSLTIPDDERLVNWRETMSGKVRKALLERPGITNQELYREFSCTRQLVCQLRKELREQPDRRPQQARRTQAETQPRRPRQSPERRAERIRQLWPVASYGRTEA